MLNVLLTSVGRRVSLVKFFKEALDKRSRIYAADCDNTAPGLYVADKAFIVPKVNDKNYIPFLLEKSKKEDIKLIVPLIDPELPILAKERDLFFKEGIMPLISTYDVVMMGYDKLLTAKFFQEINIPTPKTLLYKKDLDLSSKNFPLIIKPRFGSASIGVQKCENMQDIKFYSTKISDPILQ
ncbi:MAG: ATP-grasp domain-containing protein, partial [Nitrososphaerota archaeon]